MNETSTGVTARKEREVTNRRWSLAVITVAQMMVTLDATVMIIALPSAQHGIGLSDASRQWIFTAYTLSYGGFLLLGGRLGDLVGRRRALLLGAIGFAASSALGGAAVDPAMLIVGRALQGTFAAVLAPATLALVTITFTDQRARAKAFGLYSGGIVAGIAIGLILGGALTEYLSWRWCMYINIPIVACVVAGVLATLPNPPRQRGIRLDVPGALLGCAGMAALVFALGSAATYSWTAPLVIGSLIAAVVLLVAFAIVELVVPNPLLPLRLFANRNRTGSFLAGLTSIFGAYGIFLFMTVQLQNVMKYPPLLAGLAFVPYVAVTVATSTQLVPRLLPNLPPRTLIVPGLLCIAAALLLMTRTTPDSSYFSTALPILVLFGLGMGSVIAPSMSTATSVGDAGDAGIVSALMNSSQQIGGSIGTSLLNTIAAGVTAAYLKSHSSNGRAVDMATVHADGVASFWGAVILVFSAVIIVPLINTRSVSSGE